MARTRGESRSEFEVEHGEEGDDWRNEKKVEDVWRGEAGVREVPVDHLGKDFVSDEDVWTHSIAVGARTYNTLIDPGCPRRALSAPPSDPGRPFWPLCFLIRSNLVGEVGNMGGEIEVLVVLGR